MTRASTDLMLASSLLIRLTSASFDLQLRMSEMKTARPRIASPRTAGIMGKVAAISAMGGSGRLFLATDSEGKLGGQHVLSQFCSR